MSERARGICYAFNSPKGCHKSNCKFAHVRSTPRSNGQDPIHSIPGPSQVTPTTSHPSRRNEEDIDRGERRRLQEWRAQVPDRQTAPPLRHRLAAWIQSGYQLVKSEHSDARQQVLQALHSDGGLLRVRELMETAPAVERVFADGSEYLTALAGPLLKTISYHEVANSAFLEHDVDGIHIFIYGTGGRRAVPFFTCLSTIFARMPTFSSNTFETLLATVTVMHRMAEVNGSALINENLQTVINTFDELLQRPDLKEDIRATSTHSFLRRTKQRMGLGLAIPEARSPDRGAMQDTLPTFNVGRDMPGMLSASGPRHDNDHHDIRQIQILPTEDEVASAERSEYLPIRDPRSLHLPGVDGLLDRQFRLVREDTVGQLRDAVRSELQKLRHLSGTTPDPHTGSRGARTSTYHDIQLEKLHFDQDGICAEISFAQPPFLVSRSPKEREYFYENSKRLRHDSLLCIVDSTGSTTFFSVSETRSSPQKKGPDRTPSILWQHVRGAVMIRLTQPHGYDIKRMMHCFANHGHNTSVLVEFPGVLLAAFYHTLAALQNMTGKMELPFSDVIAPDVPVVSTKVVKPEPPQYSLVPGFAFDLGSLIDEQDHLELRPNKRFDYAMLQAHSTLDDAQQRAVVDALTRRLALIQGPPGTGKSFTGVFLVKALLANSQKAKLGPLICVCYTNHALDQVLEHLVEEKVQQIIRIGGQSKSDILKPINLREVSYAMDTTATERARKRQLVQSLEDTSKLVRSALDGLQDPGTWERLETHLHRRQHFHLADFKTLAHAHPQIDAEGFETVKYDKRSPLDQWLMPGVHALEAVPQSEHCRTVDQLNCTSIFAMTMNERITLSQVWQDEITETLTAGLVVLLKECSKIRDGLQKCRQEKDLRCLRGANVIGITTSGLARNIDLLRLLPSKVLLCEEAGEVLEAHLLTAMLPRIEHCILIGDHEQLRPQIANYELQSTNRRGEQYSLDVSLFERLIHPPYPCYPKLAYSTLEVQRRMHPSISQLVRRTLYPRLKDHESVLSYSQVAGVSKRLYWLDHTVPEAVHEGTSSHSNEYEVEVTAALLTHLVRQGAYQPGEIAVLTPYLGQFVKLRKRLASQFEITVDEKDADQIQKQGLDEDMAAPQPIQRTTLLKALRLATVDNFQGEEAKVVVVSLVRSNQEKRCGFLSTSNRVNVLLSRARHGMYLIGDSTCYQSVPMWDAVLQILRQDDCIGPALTLRCPRHVNTLMEVTSPDDFLRQSPEGGCDRKCAQRLNCGHSCPQKCHAHILHDAVFCLEPCPRLHKNCSHSCPKPCGEECGCCAVPVSDVLLPCGHISTEKCFIAQDITLARCQTRVNRMMPDCGHEVQLKCHVEVDKARCPAICGALLPCGHNCRRPCHECNVREDAKISKMNHGKCTVPCGNSYNTCEHHCVEPCHRSVTDCKPCKERCNVFCNHSRCSKSCQEPCAPCAETCNAGCEHTGLCVLPCSVPCDLIPCSKRCKELLKCGHQCPSVCGEQCPSELYCQKCATEDIKQKIVDYTEFSRYCELDLDEDPCCVLACGHILSIGSLDGIMGIEEHYQLDANHNVLSIKGQSQPFSVEQKNCPECRHPLRNLQRYNRIWRRGQLDESTKKFISWSTATFVPLSKRLDILEGVLSKSKIVDIVSDNEPIEDDEDQGVPLGLELSGPRDEISSTVLGIKDLRARYGKIADLWKTIKKFLKDVTEDEQPFGRVYNMVQNLRLTQQTLSIGMARDETVLQPRQRLLATSLSLRCDLVILADFLQLRKDNSSTFAGKYDWRTIDLDLQLDRPRRDCLNLSTEASERKLPATEVEALVSFAHFTALEWSIALDAKRTQLSSTRTEAQTHLTHAHQLCRDSPAATAGLVQEIEQAELSLRDSTFYAPVSNDERRQIVAAMASEFRVNGHWYQCVNGHPFTIANCGMAMQEGACPECGARVGGGHHMLVQGNTRAVDIEEEFGGLRL